MIGWWNRAAHPAPWTGFRRSPGFGGPPPRIGTGAARDGCRNAGSRPPGTARIAPFRRWAP